MTSIPGKAIEKECQIYSDSKNKLSENKEAKTDMEKK